MKQTHPIFDADTYFVPEKKKMSAEKKLTLFIIAVIALIVVLNVVLADKEAKLHEVEQSLGVVTIMKTGTLTRDCEPGWFGGNHCTEWRDSL
jgi:hypothetical protein